MNTRIPVHANLTPEDEFIFAGLHCYSGGSFNHEAYELGIADRNDYAIMVARTVLREIGCPATRRRYEQTV